MGQLEFGLGATDIGPCLLDAHLVQARVELSQDRTLIHADTGIDKFVRVARVPADRRDLTRNLGTYIHDLFWFEGTHCLDRTLDRAALQQFGAKDCSGFAVFSLIRGNGSGKGRAQEHNDGERMLHGYLSEQCRATRRVLFEMSEATGVFFTLAHYCHSFD